VSLVLAFLPLGRLLAAALAALAALMIIDCARMDGGLVRFGGGLLGGLGFALIAIVWRVCRP